MSVIAGLALWFSGVLVGALFTGYIFYQWLRQDPKRLGTVIRWIVAGIAQHSGGAYVKVYAALFETNRATKVLVYVKPDDLCDAIGWYARKLQPFPLTAGRGFSDDNRASPKDEG